MQRPTGISLLAILYLIGGSFDLVMSCFAVVAGDRLLEEAETPIGVPPILKPYLPTLGSLVFWIGLFGTCASLFKLGTGAGLWALQPWSWWLVLLRAALKLVSNLAAVVQGSLTPSVIVGVLVNGIVLLYLSTRQVRQSLSGATVDATSQTI